MTLLDAIKALVKIYPGIVVTGYWVRNEGYIFNTKINPAFSEMAAPGQFVVTQDGNVYGTNPIRSNLDLADMKKI